MNTENFIEFLSNETQKHVTVSKSSIAAIEDLGLRGVRITLKEKRQMVAK